MNTDTKLVDTTYEQISWPKLCWKAIFGGTIAAIGIHILLSMLGMGAGLATFSPVTDDNAVTHFNIGAAIIWSLCAVVSLFFGALLAGRFSQSSHTGFVHGVLVWSLTLILTLLLLADGASMVLGGGLKVLGAGLGIGAKAVSSGVGDAAKEGVKRTGDELTSFIDEVAPTTSTNGAASSDSVRAKRDVGFAVAKLFAPENDISSADNRTAAIKAVAAATKKSDAEAAAIVDNWITSYKNLKAELDHAKEVAEQKAREAADRAAHDLSCVAIWSFFALLIGLAVSALGGSCGGKWAVRHADVRVTTVVAP